MTVLSSVTGKEIDWWCILPNHLDLFLTHAASRGCVITNINREQRGRTYVTIDPKQKELLFWAVQEFSEKLISPRMRNLLKSDGTNISNLASPHPYLYGVGDIKLSDYWRGVYDRVKN